MSEQWLDMCSAEELAAGEGKAFEIAGERIAIFRLQSGELRSIDDTCPHAFGSLGGGMLIRGNQVSCASHGWLFDLDTGVCMRKPDIRLQRYPVREKEGLIQISVTSLNGR